MKMKFGAIVVAGSGKIGGHVASKNRGGAYLRTKVTPSNPNTPAQASARALLSSLATAWSELTEAQRLGWNAAVKDFATTDIFGDIKNPSGINLHIKLNANLVNAGLAQIVNAPAKVEVPFSPIATAMFSASLGGDAQVAFSDAALNAVKVLVSATPKVSAGTTFVKNLYRNIGSFTVADEFIDYRDAYIAKYGNLAVGDKIYLSVEPVMPNGQKGTAQTVAVIVTA